MPRVVKWCLHKGLAWCVVHREWHEERHVEITTFSDQQREFFCTTCGGRKVGPHEEACKTW